MEELKKEIEELKYQIKQLYNDIAYMKAMEILRSQQIEDSIKNRTLLYDIVKELQVKNYVVKEEIEEDVNNDNLTIILDCLKAGKKIQAIKKIREITGVGLYDAKKAFEMIEAIVKK